MFLFNLKFVFVKPRAVPPIFCLNGQADSTANLGTLQTNYLDTAVTETRFAKQETTSLKISICMDVDECYL